MLIVIESLIAGVLIGVALNTIWSVPKIRRNKKEKETVADILEPSREEYLQSDHFKRSEASIENLQASGGNFEGDKEARDSDGLIAGESHIQVEGEKACSTKITSTPASDVFPPKPLHSDE